MLQRIYDALDPVAFSIGPFEVRWYGILFVLSFFLAGLIFFKVAKHWKLAFDTDDLLTIIVAGIIGAIVGARIAYVTFYGDGYYVAYPLKVFALNEGGLSFHGGLIGGIIAAYVVSRIIKMPFLSILDLGLISAPLGLGLVRCANFINGELWGAPSDVPWAVVFGGSGGLVARHPSQLYEALLEGLVLLAVMLMLARRIPPRPQGTFTGIFLIIYACFRILVENVRIPDVQVGYLFGTGWFTMGMLLSIPLLAAGVCFLVYARKTKLPQRGHGA